MFAKSFTAGLLLLSVALNVSGHTLITPALGVNGKGARSDAQRVAQPNGCGKANAAAIDSSQAVTAAADGSFTVTATDFNAGADGSRSVTGAVDATGQGKAFAGKVTVSKNGDPAPKAVGSDQISASLPAGTKCTGGATGNKCLVSFSTGKFGNCVVVQQGAAAAGGAPAAGTGAAGAKAAAGNPKGGAAANKNAAGAGNAAAGNANAAAGNANAAAAKGGVAKNAGAANNAAAGNANAGATQNAQKAKVAKPQAGTRAARALLSDLEARGEEHVQAMKRGLMNWVWA